MRRALLVLVAAALVVFALVELVVVSLACAVFRMEES